MVKISGGEGKQKQNLHVGGQLASNLVEGVIKDSLCLYSDVWVLIPAGSSACWWVALVEVEAC